MPGILVLIGSVFMSLLTHAKEPIVTAKKLIEYKKAGGYIHDCRVPETVLVCYQRSTMQYLLNEYPEFQKSQAITHLYMRDDERVGILGDWGVGAPGLAIKMEELIALGAKRFIAVGTAGGLMHEHPIAGYVICPQALAEDGVAHLYLSQGESIIAADQKMVTAWDHFAKARALPYFKPAMAWSFSAIFRETLADVRRVRQLGCSVVEMEAATLYAIGQEKGVQTLSLFVISDSIRDEAWIPHFKEPAMMNNLHQLGKWALEFCVTEP